jgi:plasmid maintenance system antidote protein VapI
MGTTLNMADIIRAAIKRDGRTRYALAQESGVNQAVLGRFVRGERGLNLDTADRLCRVLGLELRPVRKRKTR